MHGGGLLSLTLLLLGDVERGLQVGVDSLKSADELRHAHSTAIAITYIGGWVFGLCGASGLLLREARKLIKISEEHQLGVFKSLGEAALGWALCQEGDLVQGTVILNQAVAQLEDAEFQTSLPGFLAVLAEAERQRGMIDQARTHSARARALVSEANVWLDPEVRRLAAFLAEPVDVLPRLADAAARARELGLPLLELRCLYDMRNVTSPEALPLIDERIAALPADLRKLPQHVARLQRQLR